MRLLGETHNEWLPARARPNRAYRPRSHCSFVEGHKRQEGLERQLEGFLQRCQASAVAFVV